MPVPVMVRFDDDVAEKLREQAYVERVSVNRLVNNVMRQYVEAGATTSDDASTVRAELLSNVETHIEAVRDTLKPLAHQESEKDYIEKMRITLEALTDCVASMYVAMAPENIPVLREAVREKTHA